jgi:hypothetical protein
MTAQSVRLTSVRFALFATLVALVTAPSAFADQTKVVSNGATANHSAYDGSCTWTWVTVSRNTTAAGTETFIYYSVYDSCVGEHLTYGNGRMANADFKVSNKTAKVRTDLSYDPNFYFYGARGRVDLAWTIDPSVSDRYDGTYESKRPDYRTRQKGMWEHTAAAVSGTIVGKSLENAEGSVGSSKSVSLHTWR